MNGLVMNEFVLETPCGRGGCVSLTSHPWGASMEVCRPLVKQHYSKPWLQSRWMLQRGVLLNNYLLFLMHLICM